MPYNFEENTFINPSGMYASWGQYLERLEQYEKCIKFYNEAQTFENQNPTILMAKSRVMTKAMRFKEAIEDADEVLAIDKRNIQALHMKACGYYGLNEFEKSLLLFQAGFQKRKKPSYFLDGIKQALETIEGSIGVGSGNVMIDLLPTIKRMNGTKETVEEPKILTTQEIAAIDGKIKTMSSKYLGRMADDLSFAKKLSNDDRVRSKNAKHTAELQEKANAAHTLLYEHLMSLRARRPMYAIKNSDNKEHTQVFKKIKEDAKKIQMFNSVKAKELIDESIKALKEKDSQLCFDTIEKAKRYINSKTSSEISGKRQFLARIFELTGEAILSQKRLNMNMSNADNEKRVKFLFGLPISRRGSQDSVLKFNHTNFRNKQEYIGSIKKSLQAAQSSMEECYCYHELSETYCNQGKYNLSMFYATKLVTNAKMIPCLTWELNGMILVIRNHMVQHNPGEVRTTIYEAFGILRGERAYQDTAAFLKLADHINDEIPYDETDNDEEKRMQDIINNMVDEDSKKEIKMLFSQMSKIPESRRFRIIPTKTKQSRKQKPGVLSDKTIRENGKVFQKPVHAIEDDTKILGKPVLK